MRIALVASVVIALTFALGAWWFRGGTYLGAQGAGYGGVVLPGEQLSFGVDLTTNSGPSVVLDHVSATTTGGVQVSWSIYRNSPDTLGFGSVHGALAPQWPTVPVHGYRVAQPRGHPERGGTWLVATATAARPGVYRLAHVTIEYRSGGRVRHADAHTTICELVAPPADEPRLAQQEEHFEPGTTALNAVDPLVAQFETCTDPSLAD